MVVVLSGSHAAGEAVWASHDGRRVCLSDLDLYLVVPDETARRAAERRVAAGRKAMAERLDALGLPGPLELAIHTPAAWRTMPARPASLELRRHGRVLAGDPVWLERIPEWSPRDVSAEEVLLLHENRAFELIAARWLLEGDGLAGLRSRHATLKCALDLAAVERLRAGAWEDGAAGRVRAVRAARAPMAGAPEDPPWDAALAWRGPGAAEPDGERGEEWWRTVRSWVALWADLVRPGTPSEPFERTAIAAARRARLRRRVRLALRHHSRSGRGPRFAERLARTLVGTPQHRLNASAAAFLAAACAARDAGASGSEVVRARLSLLLDRLGAVRATGDEAVTARELVTTWDGWVLDGQRSERR
jgi:hypothetical protein